jgi:tetratricopeptide (TPR) repeat protein
LYGLIAYNIVRGQLRVTHELSQQFLRQAERRSDSAALPVARRLLGATQLWLGQLAQARVHLEESIALHQAEQPPAPALAYGQASAAIGMVDLAFNLWLLGYPDQAREWVEEARFSSGIIYDSLGDWPNALSLAEATISLATEHGLIFWRAGGAIIREAMRVRQGQAGPETMAELRQNLAIYRATGAVVGLPYMLYLLAEALGRTEQPAEGLSLLAEAQAVVAETEHRTWEAELYRLQGELLLKAEGREARLQDERPQVAAEACFQQAIAIAQRQAAKSWELRAVMSLTRLWHPLRSQGKQEEARQILSEIYDWFSEGFETRGLREAKALLDALA